MPDGMAAMFDGKYFWKMPPDIEMEIEPDDHSSVAEKLS